MYEGGVRHRPPFDPRFDADQLRRLASEHAAAYQSAAPFPHVVLDGLLPEALLDDVIDTFPDSRASVWIRHDDPMQRKLQWSIGSPLPQSAADLVAQLQGPAFLGFLQRVTGIEGLIGDPYLHHGGLHMLEPGGFLKLHADDLTQPRLALVRRVNLILYLNRQWDDEWGGQLELWDADMSRCEQSINPSFNRMVVLDVRADGYHGHPDPITAPPGVTRRSLALYYYTSPVLAPEQWEGRAANHPVARPNETIRPLEGIHAHHGLRRELAPPILLRWWQETMSQARRAKPAAAPVDARRSVGPVRELLRSPEHHAQGRFEATVAVCFASSAETLAETLGSLRSQAGAPPFELLLISNGTTDDSVQIATQATTGLPVRIIECPSVGYDANARNVAIDEAGGEVILFVDADDVVADDYVAEMVAALSHADFVTAIWEYGKLNGDRFPELRGDDARFETLPFRYRGWPYAPAGTLGVRRDVARDIGGFDTGLEMGANNDWCFGPEPPTMTWSPCRPPSCTTDSGAPGAPSSASATPVGQGRASCWPAPPEPRTCRSPLPPVPFDNEVAAGRSRRRSRRRTGGTAPSRTAGQQLLGWTAGTCCRPARSLWSRGSHVLDAGALDVTDPRRSGR